MEILLSLLILSGSLVSLLSGLQVSQQLSHHANFEELAAFFAEREMEVLKADLLAGRRLGEKILTAQGRFKLPSGWKTLLRWSVPNELGLRRLMCQVLHGSEQFAIESFLFCPKAT